MNLEVILDDEDLLKQYLEETPGACRADFEQEVRRLYAGWKHHHWDCKCLLCR